MLKYFQRVIQKPFMSFLQPLAVKPGHLFRLSTQNSIVLNPFLRCKVFTFPPPRFFFTALSFWTYSSHPCAASISNPLSKTGNQAIKLHPEDPAASSWTKYSTSVQLCHNMDDIFSRCPVLLSCYHNVDHSPSP